MEKKIKIGKERKYINHSSMILVLIFDFVGTKLILVYTNEVDLEFQLDSKYDIEIKNLIWKSNLGTFWEAVKIKSEKLSIDLWASIMVLYVSPQIIILYSRYYKPGLYFFYPIFTLAAAYIADNLCTKNGNFSFFELIIRGL